MEPIERELLARANRAYELGRFRAGLRASWPAIGVAALAWSQHRGLGWLAFLDAFVLLGLATGFVWRGEGWQRGVWPGWAAGSLPLLMPTLTMRLGMSCGVGGRCMSLCLGACLTAGLLSGFLLGIRALAEAPGERARVLTSAAFIAALTGAVGCGIMGAAGILGMAAAGLVGAAPVLLRARPAGR